MSALQSDLFGLMGEGDIQCRGRDSPNLCRIEAVCEQKAAQAPELFQFIALHGGAKITKLVERGYFSAQHQYYNIFYLVRFLPDMFTVPYNLLYSWAFIWLSESLILLNPGLLLVLYSFSHLLTLKKVLFAGTAVSGCCYDSTFFRSKSLTVSDNILEVWIIPSSFREDDEVHLWGEKAHEIKDSFLTNVLFVEKESVNPTLFRLKRKWKHFIGLSRFIPV